MLKRTFYVIAIAIIAVWLVIFSSGCEANLIDDTSDPISATGNNDVSEEYTGETRFSYVSSDFNGERTYSDYKGAFTILMDNETKVQYAIFGSGKSRIGVVLLNADGTPQLATDDELQ
mgnify:CR=1 FL=1